jgi:hypothetical protein
MADVTITGLPNAAALTGTERVPMDQSGTTVDAAASAIAGLATAATVGLGNVNNTSDLSKPISTATQAALDGKAATGAIGGSGLTMAAGVLGRESGTGAPVVLTLSGLSIVNGVLTVAGGGSGTVTSVGLSVPTGFAVAGSPITASGTLALSFAAGYSLPLTATQASWDAAAVLAGTAVQPAGLASTLTGYVQTSDSRLSDSREWSATTISQAEAEAGSATTRRAFTAQRVFQAAAAWWVATATATGQALATAANAAAARTTLGLGGAATAAIGTTTGTVAAGDDSRITGALSAATAASTYQPLDSDLTSIAALTTTAFGRSLLTQADGAATRNAIGAGTSSLAVSSSAPAALGASASAGSSTDAARSDHVHARSTYADLGPIGDGLILVISNKGETATAATNYAEVPVPVPSGSFTLTGVRFGCHIDNTGSSSSTFSAYKRTAGGTKTTVLSGNATLSSSASVVDASGTITTSSFSAGDRVGVDLVGVGTGAQGLFAQFTFTRSAT